MQPSQCKYSRNPSEEAQTCADPHNAKWNCQERASECTARDQLPRVCQESGGGQGATAANAVKSSTLHWQQLPEGLHGQWPEQELAVSQAAVPCQFLRHLIMFGAMGVGMVLLLKGFDN